MRKLSPDSVLSGIGQADHFEELRELRIQFAALLPGDPPPADFAAWNEKVNEMHDILIRRAIVLAERILQAEGFGGPPVPYAFIVFGSGGRREQTLWSDQDNGIVYGEPAGGSEAAAAYFARLSERIIFGLKQAGYPPCDGGVICTNPQWRKPIGEWLGMVRRWETERSWEAVRYLLIHADMRCVYGRFELMGDIKRSFFAYVHTHRAVLQHMLQNTLHRKVTLNPLGQLVTERYGEEAGGIDVKYGIYIPFVNGVRMLAICHGVGETSTLGRLTVLEGLAADGGQDAEWKFVFENIMRLRALCAHHEEQGLFKSKGMLAAAALTKERRHELKNALRAGRKLQKHVKKAVQSDGSSGWRRGG